MTSDGTPRSGAEETAWIRTVPAARADAELAALYRRIRGPQGEIDNIMRAHSLRPHTLEGHLALYKAVLHHRGNRLPRWLLELVGIRVSHLNGCRYCVGHHAAGLRRLVDADRAEELIAAACTAYLDRIEEPRIRSALHYTDKLTLEPARIAEEDIAALHADFDDGEILELDQVVAYFAYANRTVLGLGVTTRGDTPGLSPSNADDPENWSHR